MLIKESKDFKDKNRTLAFDNDEFRTKICTFEKELEDL